MRVERVMRSDKGAGNGQSGIDAASPLALAKLNQHICRRTSVRVPAQDSASVAAAPAGALSREAIFKPATEAGKMHWTEATQVRRSRSLVGVWEDSMFVIENYLTGARTALSAEAVAVLSNLDSPRPAAEALELLNLLPAPSKALERLIAQDVMVFVESALDVKEQHIADTWTWGTDARYFHYGGQHFSYQSNLETESESLGRLSAVTPAPQPYKDYETEAVPLAPDSPGLTVSLGDALLGRRTCRVFEREALSFGAFSTILWSTWGQVHAVNHPQAGAYLLKSSPSGGARHPIEVYPVVLRVAGVLPGVYHYSVRRNGLELVRAGQFEDMVTELCGRQSWVRDTAAVFFMTGVVTRSMWKYEHARAYRVMLLDAGHLGQTFHLACTALGLGPFSTAVLDDRAVEDFLGIDGVGEVALYAAAVGVADGSIDLPSNRGADR